MNKKIEIIANVSLIVIGLIAGVLFFRSGEKDLSLILFSIALACILYQFLGGIGDSNSFQLGAIKFGGAAAILIGFMFFLKKIVFVPTPEIYKLKVSEQYWFPVSTETGKIKTVTFKSAGNEMQFPSSSGTEYVEERKKHEYQISKKNSSQFCLELKCNPTDTVGYVDINNFKNTGLFNKTTVAEDEKRIQIFMLYPDVDSLNSSKKLESVFLPFEIKVFNTSRFSIEPYYKNYEIVKRTSYIIPGSEKDEVYVVFLEQANSSDSVKSNRYSKWLVKKMKYKIED